MCHLIDTIHSHCNHTGRLQIETVCSGISTATPFSPSHPFAHIFSPEAQELPLKHNSAPGSGCWRNQKLGGIKYLESYCAACLYRRRNGLEGVTFTYRLDHPEGGGWNRHCALTRGVVAGEPLRGVTLSSNSQKWDLKEPVERSIEARMYIRLGNEETLVGEAEDDDREGEVEEEQREREKLLQLWESHMRSRRDGDTDEEEELVVEKDTGLNDGTGREEDPNESQDLDPYPLNELQMGRNSRFSSSPPTLSDSESSSLDSDSEEERDWESVSSVPMGWEESSEGLFEREELC